MTIKYIFACAKHSPLSLTPESDSVFSVPSLRKKKLNPI